MATSFVTNANVATAIIKLVAVDALPALMGNLVMGNLVNRDFEARLQEGGDTVNVPMPPTGVTSNALADGAAVVLQSNNLGNGQIVLNVHQESSFSIPDVTKVLANPDLLSLYMQPALVVTAEKIETDLLALATSFTANTAVGAAITPITEAVLDSAETALFTARANGQRYLVCDASTYGQLRQIQRFSEFNTAAEAGANAIIQGKVGKLKDVLIFRSQFVKSTGSGGSLTGNNLMFTKDAIGMAIRRLPKPLPGTGAIAEYAELGNFGMRVTMSYTPGTLSQLFTVDVFYGVAILRNDHGIIVKT